MPIMWPGGNKMKKVNVISVEEIIATLTKAEKVQHEDLIEECRKREKQIIAQAEISTKNIIRFASSLEKICSDLALLSIYVHDLCETLLEQSLNNIPIERFYKE